MKDEAAWEARRTVESILREVAKRGWTQTSTTFDSFAELRKDARVLEAQIAMLYELYFPPERHEFEWESLAAIARVVAEGAAGNAAYDLLKSMCSFVASQFQSLLGAGGAARGENFRQIAKDAECLSRFFAATKRARAAEIEEKTGIPRERIATLMKLAGLTHYRAGELFCSWELPESC